GGAQYESFDFPVMVEATTRVRFYYQLPSEQELKNDSTLDKNKPILKAVHTDERQLYPDKVKVIQAVIDGDGIRADLTDELSLHWRPSTTDHDESANTAPQSNESANTLSEEINNALWDLKVHPQTEENTNDIVEPNLEVIVNFPAELKLKAVYLALHTGEDDEMDKKWLTVPKGQLTFDAEGNDFNDNVYFSRVIHWPGNELSGVTIGRGYDLGSRSQIEVYDELVKAYVDKDTAKLISKGAGLKGESAEKFVNENKAKIGEITRKSQHFFFVNIFPSYEQRAKNNYNKWTKNHSERTDWDLLDNKIQDVLIDFVYQGFTKGERPMVKGMKNDKQELIGYIRSNPILKSYEMGRKRANYLQGNN
uniref:S-type pyocin domain-containing protein n=1 Tax=uncultured Shewanella sp. TaxID=173975 RepID=UPI00260C142D